VNRHEIWRRVEFDYRQLSARAPEGYEPVVDVYLAGREQPIELGWVVTHRAPDDSWVRFQQHNRAFDDADGGRHLGDLFVQVHETAILGIEVRYEPTGKRSRAFDWQVADDDGEPCEPSPAG
jgi:hypothetical protein